MKQTITILLFLLATTLCAQEQQPTARINKSLTIYNDVMRQLDINYVDTLDYDKLTTTGIRHMLSQVDPYTVYIPKEEDESLKMMTTGKYGGIGAIIMQRDSAVFINEPYEGMPAQQNDVLAGDKILEVDGVKCLGKSTKEVSDLLRGKEGTIVHLKLQRPGLDKPLVREFERREIHLPSVSYYAAISHLHIDCDTLPTQGMGYILFSEFTSGSSQDFLLAIEDMVSHQGVDKLVIDLRSNGGGLIDEAIKLVSLFVDKGTDVVSTKGKTQSSNRTYTTQTSPLYRSMPLVILVDGHTASAAEIVSGSLQDLHRATLVGQRTFGKGLVQSIRPVAFEGHLKVTTAHYYLPSGRCIQAIDYAERQKGNQLKRDTAGGILPDIVTDDSSKVDICFSLYRDNMFFDYSVLYHALHDSVASPDSFSLTDEELDDFIRYLDAHHYTYQTETGKYFHDVLEMAEHEDIDSTTMADLRAMQERLTPSYREAILNHQEQVKQLLSEEIMERYYFQRGRIAYVLRHDDELVRAISQLNLPSNTSSQP